MIIPPAGLVRALVLPEETHSVKPHLHSPDSLFEAFSLLCGWSHTETQTVVISTF